MLEVRRLAPHRLRIWGPPAASRLLRSRLEALGLICGPATGRSVGQSGEAFEVDTDPVGPALALLLPAAGTAWTITVPKTGETP